MDRRKFLLTSSLLATASPLTRLLGAALPLTAGTHKVIRGGVGYYTNSGGTIGYYLPENAAGGVMIDTQFPDPAREFLAEVLNNEVRLDLLINTHHHGDHTGGNGVISPIATNYVTHARAKENLAANEAKRTEGDKIPLPTTVFEKDWSLTMPDGKETVTARHFGAAHTGGDAVIHFENANVAHVGDLMFNRRFPYVDPAAGGNMTNWIGVLKKIKKHYDRDTVFIFGHAAESYPVTGDADDLSSFADYLKSLRHYVKREKKAGTSLEALKAKTTVIPRATEWKYGERLRDINLEVMWGEV